MKITRSEILNIASKKPLSYHLERKDSDANPYLIAISDMDIEIYFEDVMESDIKARIKASGNMICPCAMTLEEVEVPIEINESIYLSEKEEEDNYFLGDEIDLDDLLLEIILPYAPIKVVKEGKIEYPMGDGWRVLSEEMLNDLHKDEIDPRLAKLMEYKFDDEEKE